MPCPRNPALPALLRGTGLLPSLKGNSSLASSSTASNHPTRNPELCESPPPHVSFPPSYCSVPCASVPGLEPPSRQSGLGFTNLPGTTSGSSNRTCRIKPLGHIPEIFRSSAMQQLALASSVVDMTRIVPALSRGPLELGPRSTRLGIGWFSSPSRNLLVSHCLRPPSCSSSQAYSQAIAHPPSVTPLLALAHSPSLTHLQALDFRRLPKPSTSPPHRSFQARSAGDVSVLAERDGDEHMMSGVAQAASAAAAGNGVSEITDMPNGVSEINDMPNGVSGITHMPNGVSGISGMPSANGTCSIDEAHASNGSQPVPPPILNEATELMAEGQVADSHPSELSTLAADVASADEEEAVTYSQKDEDSKEAGAAPVVVASDPAAVSRRRAGGRGRAQQSELLAVPGVGPRNLQKLRASGIEEVATLTKIYREKTAMGAGMEQMVNFLRQDVGVRKDHATLISAFSKHKAELESGESEEEKGEKEEGDSAGRAKSKRLTFCVEGNISVGKSTFLRRAGELLNLHELVEIVPEPIEQWQNVGMHHRNLLQEFYDDPKKYAYTFQNYVFVTRVMQSINTREGPQSLRLMERSIFSDRMVFVRAVHEAKWLDDVQLSVYDSSFDPFVTTLPGLVPDGFIYLRANPETCHQRLMRRAREEETKVSFDYLANLHEKHEGWLYPNAKMLASLGGLEKGVLVGREPQDRLLINNRWPGDMHSVPVPANLMGKVFGLAGADVHPSIQNVPALVLDCNEHIDFNVTPNQVNWFAEDIREFFKFVKKMKEKDAEKPKPSQLLSPDQCMSNFTRFAATQSVA